MKRIIYKHDDVVRAIKTDAEQRYGRRVARVRWFYNMDDKLRYEVFFEEDS